MEPLPTSASKTMALHSSDVKRGVFVWWEAPSFRMALSYTWMSHVKKMYESRYTHERVILLIIMSHFTHLHINQSCYTYKWVMLHISMSHVTPMNESSRSYKWVMSHIWTSHVRHMNDLCRTYKWDMSQVWMSHVTHINESCHTNEWVMSHTQMSQVFWSNPSPLSFRIATSHIWIQSNIVSGMSHI